MRARKQTNCIVMNPFGTMKKHISLHLRQITLTEEVILVVAGVEVNKDAVVDGTDILEALMDIDNIIDK